MPTSILISPLWEKTPIAVGQPLANDRKAYNRERKACRLVVVEGGLDCEG
jgi:hypothetical protein